MPLNALGPFTVDAVIYGAGAAGALWLLYPRLSYFIEYRLLSGMIKTVTGHNTFSPRTVKVKTPLAIAHDCVRRALASRQADHRWMIKHVHFAEPIECAVRLEGTTVVQETPAMEMQRHKQGRGRNSCLRIQVDITQSKGETLIDWKFMPEDQAQFSRNLQVLDKETSLLLARTNFNIIKELGLAR